jgi:hypothetical protein
MKTQSTLRPTKTPSLSLNRLDKYITLPSNPTSTLKAVIVYEDLETREWAQEAHDRVARLAGPHPVRTTWWKLNNLSEPGVLAGAVSTAMRAEIVIVALRSEEGLPLPFYTWVNHWLPHRPRHGGILAGLIGDSGRRTARSGRIGAYLRSVAEQGNLHFILSENKLSHPALLAESVNGAVQSRPINGHSRPALAVRAAARSRDPPRDAAGNGRSSTRPILA